MTNTSRSNDPRDEIIRHLPRMRAFAVSLTHNASAADDLVQDTIVKAWRAFDSYEPGTNLQAWLFTILRNIFYSDVRKARRELLSSQDQLSEHLTSHDHGDNQIALIDFERALRTLPADQREALVLVGAFGLSYEDAAATCGVPIGTIKSRINRGRARLAALLDHEPKQDSTAD